MTDAATRVAFVHHWLVGRRGGEKALEALLALAPGAPLFTLLHDPDACPTPADAARVVTSPLQRWPGAARWFRAALPWLPRFYRRLDLAGHDLVVSSDASLAKTVTVPAGARHVCYCYSPVRYAWDLQETYLSRSLPAVLRPLARRLLKGVRRDDWLAARRVDRFVAISEHVAARIRRWYERDCDVVPPPVDTGFFTPGPALDVGAPIPAGERPYLLLGAAVSYKRFEDGVEACRRLDRPLVVAGSGPVFDGLRRRAGPRTRFEPSPSDERVRELYRSCRALLFPGEEDFGLTAVEAMACGRPVVAWGRGGVAETVVDGTTGTLYADPGPEGLMTGLTAFEAGEGRLRPEDGVARAARFSRERFAERMGALLERQAAAAAHGLVPAGARA